MVLSNPILRAMAGAASWEKADSRPVQKKNSPACPSDNPNRSKSHSVSSELTTSPPANASTLNYMASLKTMRRDGPNGAGRWPV